ncbi:MAG TPA: hypothetical protein VLT45_31570 [Kofleriaceae bacterium]|nr:hypothetical protein [Kofleriaceae bacterium]
MRSIPIIAIVITAGACTPSVPDKVSYDQDVAPILEANCMRCHSSAQAVSLKNCVAVDNWDSATDPSGTCKPMVMGVHDGAGMIVNDVMSGKMPKDGPPLTDRQKKILEAWKAAGFPRRANNEPPTITFITPPASGAMINTGGVTTYDIQYDVSDPDGDAVTWDLTWKGPNGRTGSFATGLSAGTGTVHADTSSLGTGSYQVIANLSDGSSMVSIPAQGMLTVPSGYNAAPTVTVTAPNGGESYYVTQTITVSWLGNDDGPTISCDVVAISGSTTTTIATGVMESSGQPASVMWNPASATPATNYQIKVTVHDTGSPSLSASDTSDATFTISPPPQNVSFKNQILPLLTASGTGCISSQCHDATLPQQGLDLTATKAYNDIVGVTASQCTSEKLITPGAPDQSYLITKLVGSGTCYTGSQMPKTEPAFTAAQIQLFRDWTTNGAPNN